MSVFKKMYYKLQTHISENAYVKWGKKDYCTELRIFQERIENV